MAVLNITSENYEKEVVGSKLPVLLDFWAPWCKYCRRIAPVVERVAQEYEGKVVVAQCNVDDAPALAQQFKVDIIPSPVSYTHLYTARSNLMWDSTMAENRLIKMGKKCDFCLLYTS